MRKTKNDTDQLKKGNPQMNAKEKVITALKAYDKYNVSRSWLRLKFEQGLVRRLESEGVDKEGRHYIKYHYYEDDIVRVLKASADHAPAPQPQSPQMPDADDPSPLSPVVTKILVELRNTLNDAVASSSQTASGLAARTGMSLLTLDRIIEKFPSMQLSMYAKLLAACDRTIAISLNLSAQP